MSIRAIIIVGLGSILLAGCAGPSRIATGRDVDHLPLGPTELTVVAPNGWLVSDDPFPTSWTGEVLWHAVSSERARLLHHDSFVMRLDPGVPGKPPSPFDPLPDPYGNFKEEPPADWRAAQQEYEVAAARADSLSLDSWDRGAVQLAHAHAEYERDRASHVARMTNEMTPGDAVVFISFERERSEQLRALGGEPAELEIEREKELSYARDEQLEHSRYSFEFTVAAEVYRAEAIVCEPAPSEVHRDVRATLRSLRVTE